MFCCTSLEQVKKVAALMLLTSATGLHAETSTDVDAEPAVVAPVQHQQNSGRQNSSEVIPPPPPGPYRSSALRNLSIQVPVFDRAPDRVVRSNLPTPNFDSANMPMDMFSPDIPWPEDVRPGNSNAPNSRSSGNASNDIKPPVSLGPRTAVPPGSLPQGKTPSNSAAGFSMPNYNYRPPGYRGPNNSSQGYRSQRYRPNVNWPSSRWLPSMGTNSAGPGYYMPGYNQQYRGSPYSDTQRFGPPPQYYNQQSYGVYNNRPMMNNYGVRSGNPARN